MRRTGEEGRFEKGVPGRIVQFRMVLCMSALAHASADPVKFHIRRLSGWVRHGDQPRLLYGFNFYPQVACCGIFSDEVLLLSPWTKRKQKGRSSAAANKCVLHFCVRGRERRNVNVAFWTGRGMHMVAYSLPVVVLRVAILNSTVVISLVLVRAGCCSFSVFRSGRNVRCLTVVDDAMRACATNRTCMQFFLRFCFTNV